jgi:hypothetical protein
MRQTEKLEKRCMIIVRISADRGNWSVGYLEHYEATRTFIEIAFEYEKIGPERGSYTRRRFVSF